MIRSLVFLLLLFLFRLFSFQCRFFLLLFFYLYFMIVIIFAMPNESIDWAVCCVYFSFTNKCLMAYGLWLMYERTYLFTCCKSAHRRVTVFFVSPVFYFFFYLFLFYSGSQINDARAQCVSKSDGRGRYLSRKDSTWPTEEKKNVRWHNRIGFLLFDFILIFIT